jgi:hypothetical protein
MLPSRRILAVDILRGSAIAAILIIHRIHYQWSGMQTREILRANLGGFWTPLIVITIALFTMAGIFYFLTGIVNTWSLYHRLQNGYCKGKKWMLGGLLSGLMLLIFSYLHRLLLVNGFIANPDRSEPEFPVGLLTGFVRDSDAVLFRWSLVTEPGTLSLIGLITIILTLTLGFLFRNGIPDNFKKINLILSLLTIGVLLATPFMKYWLRPEYEIAYQAGNYLKACCLGHVCQEFCLFPYLGYGFFGALIGLSLARNEDKKIYFRRSRIWMLALCIIGLAGVLLFDRHDALGKRIIGASVSYIELAIFILLLNTLLRMYDFANEAIQQKRWQRSVGIRRLGMVALSVYFLEPLMAELLKLGIDFLTGNNSWVASFPMVLAFGFFCLIVWWTLVYFWSKRSFTGSLEFLTTWIIFRLSGKRSTKTDYSSLQTQVFSE